MTINRLNTAIHLLEQDTRPEFGVLETTPLSQLIKVIKSDFKVQKEQFQRKVEILASDAAEIYKNTRSILQKRVIKDFFHEQGVLAIPQSRHEGVTWFFNMHGQQRDDHVWMMEALALCFYSRGDFPKPLLVAYLEHTKDSTHKYVAESAFPDMNFAPFPDEDSGNALLKNLAHLLDFARKTATEKCRILPGCWKNHQSVEYLNETHAPIDVAAIPKLKPAFI